MGLEKTTSVSIDGQAHACHVHLEPREIVCSRGVKRRFAHAEMTRLAVRGSTLEFACGSERIAIELGTSAKTWLDRIQNPRSRVQKLGVAVGMTVCVLGRSDADAIAEVADALGSAPKTRLSAAVDLVLCFAHEPAELDRLAAIAPKLAERGAVWVLWPKGRKDFSHDHVVAAGKAVGLSITKSMGFSEQLTGLRLVRAKLRA